MEYQPVSKILDGYWKCHWVGLPYEQQCVWDAALELVTDPQGKLWDAREPDERQLVVVSYEQKHDPANKEENSFWFKNACDIADAEREIREIELLLSPTPSEREAKNRLLADAHQRLADLTSAQFKPSTVGDSSGQPLSAKTANSGASESAEPTPRPMQAQRWQEHEILKAIEDLGYDPKSLPKDKSGTSGIKAIVRTKLSHHKWTTIVFDKAWERLSCTKEIVKLK